MKSKYLTDYILLGLVLALTGFEVIYRASFLIQSVLLFCIFVYFFWTNKKFNPDFFLILIPFIIPFVLQGLRFNLLPLALNNILALVIDFLFCYLVLESIKTRFHITFVNFLYFLAVFSLIFYPTQFFPPIESLIKNTIGSIITPFGTGDFPAGYRSTTLIFFNYQHTYGQEIITAAFPRNCGAFWEPGLFAVFLNLALLTNIFVNNTLLMSKKNLVLIITIVTTLSTTGYIVLFLIIISTFIFQKNVAKIILSIPLIVIIIYVSYTYVWELEFMAGKIDKNMGVASDDRESRFGAFIYHFDELREFPFGGVSMDRVQEQAKAFIEDKVTSANGISLVFFNNGYIIGILFYVLFYLGLRKWLLYNNISNKLLHFWFFFIFILLAFSQDVTGRLFYKMILFLTICIPKSSLVRNTAEETDPA